MFKVILSYVMSLKTARATSRDPALKREEKKKRKRKISYKTNTHGTMPICSMPNSILKCMLEQNMVEMETPQGAHEY